MFADIKMELQAHGLRVPERLQAELSMDHIVQPQYISFMMGEVPVGIMNGPYSESSPFEVGIVEGKTWILKDGAPHVEIRFLEWPDFFDMKTSRGTPMSGICSLVAPGFTICYVNRGCVYWREEYQCRFCIVERLSSREVKDPRDVGETMRAGVEGGAIKSHVALTAGAQPGRDRGNLAVGEAADAIKELVDIPISANTEPPKDLGYLDSLENCDSAYFNLEVFDRQARQKWIPGKGRIPLQTYEEVFQRSLELFGENQVGSVLLAGLEEDRTLLEGVRWLAEQGVIPVVEPVYPLQGSLIPEMRPPAAGRMKALYEATIEIVDENGLRPDRTRAGFIKGGALSAMGEVRLGL
jgi:radical SAM protein (TIGR04043 family)